MGDDLDSYVCSLDAKGMEKAERELNEIPSQRLLALKSFRDWVAQQRSWLKSPTDARHLLRFLRNKKFGQLKSREKFIQYWQARTKHPHLLANLDPCDPKTAEILRQVFVCMPGHDSQCRKVVISRWGRLDTSGKSYSAVDAVKALVLFNEYLSLNEQTQVGGIVVLEDFTGFGLAHSAFLGVEHMATFASIITKAFPLRLNGIHDYNNNPLMEALLAAVKPFIKKKIMGRIYLHGKSLANVYDHIEKSSLPAEYLPDDYTGPNAGTIDSIIDSFMADIQKPEVRDYLLNLSSKQFGVDEKRKPPESELITESFRSLKTD